MFDNIAILKTANKDSLIDIGLVASDTGPEVGASRRPRLPGKPRKQKLSARC
jgi:hypothetical protein